MKYWIQTFGCQMNVYDTDSMVGLLNEAGHEPVEQEEDAELILLNTCSIREGAEDRVRGRVGQLKRHKKHGKLKYIGICGCMGQKEGKRLTDSIPHLDLVMGPGAIGSVARIVDELVTRNEPIIDITGIEDEYDQPNPVAEGPVVYPRFVSVMKGCNKNCTFCVVPNTRGPERSRSPRVILQEAEALVQRGYKEITLIGQTINSYRQNGVRFPELLQMVNDIPGLERLRFTTSYPSTSLPSMLEAMAKLDKVCEYLHLPFQSGSNRILKAMKRIYSREQYMENIAYFRKQFEGMPIQPALSTDIIVGFPGETREDFEQTLNLVKTVRFDHAFMFKYSPRRGTPAAEMEEQVPEITKSQRLERLIETQNEIAKEINAEHVGTTTEVMVEKTEENPEKGLVYHTRTRTNKIVIVDDLDPSHQVGDLFNVHIDRSTAYTLYGTPIERFRLRKEEKIA